MALLNSKHALALFTLETHGFNCLSLTLQFGGCVVLESQWKSCFLVLVSIATVVIFHGNFTFALGSAFLCRFSLKTLVGAMTPWLFYSQLYRINII
jgi:hypothetical protein